MTDTQYRLTLTACFWHSLRSSRLIHNYSDFLFQLCLIRSSFQHFLKTFSTITLAIVLDAVLGYRDGNLQFLWSIAWMSDAYYSITAVGPTRCRYWFFPTYGWVDFTFCQNDELISFKLCVGCWEHLRLDYSLVSPTIYHGKYSNRGVLYILWRYSQLVQAFGVWSSYSDILFGSYSVGRIRWITCRMYITC